MNNNTEKTGDLNIKRAFKDSWIIYKKNFLFIFLPVLILQIIANFFKPIMLLSSIVFGAYCYMILKALESDDKKVHIKDFYSKLKSKFFPLLGMGLVIIIPITIAVVFFLIPALFLGTLWMFASLLIVNNDKSILSSLGTSWTIILHKKLFKNMFLFLICSVFMLILFAIENLLLNTLLNLPIPIGIISNAISFSLSQILITSSFKQQVIEDNGDLYGII